MAILVTYFFWKNFDSLCLSQFNLSVKFNGIHFFTIVPYYLLEPLLRNRKTDDDTTQTKRWWKGAITHIMRLSGGEQGSFQPGLKIAWESKEHRLDWFGDFYGGYEVLKVPTARLDLRGLNSRRCQRREHLGLLISFSGCGTEGKEGKWRLKSCEQSNIKHGVWLFIIVSFNYL